MGKHDLPYTPDSLADVWGCSPQMVRNLVKEGKLQAFRIGRLIRIKPQDVEAYEKCQSNSASDDFAEDSASLGPTPKPEVADGISFRHAPERKRKRKP